SGLPRAHPVAPVVGAVLDEHRGVAGGVDVEAPFEQPRLVAVVEPVVFVLLDEAGEHGRFGVGGPLGAAPAVAAGVDVDVGGDVLPSRIEAGHNRDAEFGQRVVFVGVGAERPGGGH